MREEELRRFLQRVAAGDLAVDEAWEALRALPAAAALGFATVDHHREWRCGHPEIVYGPGKTPEQTARIAWEIAQRARRVFVSRATRAQADAVRGVLPDAEWDETACAVALYPEEDAAQDGVCIVSAGTADQRAAREAELCCRFLGHAAERVDDVGVAGLHRLLEHLPRLRAARVIVVVAVPTPVGYGAGAGGVAPLLGMLNSCAANVAVVNIDNGVGAAVFACLVNRIGGGAGGNLGPPAPPR